MKPIKFRSAFGYDVEAASDESAVSFVGEESLTVQSMAEDADINVLMRRFGLTGTMPSNPRVPMYGDFINVSDFRSALDSVIAASEAFNALPAKVRARFGNDPQELLVFMADEANRDEAVRLGLVTAKAPVEPPEGVSPPLGAGGGTRCFLITRVLGEILSRQGGPGGLAPRVAGSYSEVVVVFLGFRL